ncbi:MAG: VWA domain-containing protein [Acidobacteriota bacterium]
MTPALIATALITSLVAAGGHAQRQGEPRPGHLVIDVVALDRHDQPLSDIRRDEVEIWINHYRVPVESFIRITPTDDEPSARSMVLLLDDVTLDPTVIPRAREAARRFVERMSPDDRIGIVTLEGPLIESTGDRARLLQAIDKYSQRLVGPLRRDQLSERVLTTLESVSRQMAEGAGRRKTIVAIGSAWLFDTPIPPPSVGRDLRPEWTAAMRAMASANASLYVIEPRGVGMTPGGYGGSSGFAREAGGYAFVSTNDLAGAADRILREASSYYLIGVADPPFGRSADLRGVEVRVLRKGVSVRARRAIPGRQ